ncbi:MAG: hypothetical protein KKB51_03010 [Candidatus Riflebacteria bacterium]|nr:hypothetical protein [Candidatus Riflebacteria bacterium]
MASNRIYRSGTSLLEIIMATVVLAVAMIPIAAMIGFGHRGTSKDFRNLTAIQLLEGTMRQVLVAEYDRVPIGNLTAPVDLGTFTLPLGTIASSSANYDLSLNVTGESVTFSYNPIRIDLNTFIATAAATWQFDASTDLKFDNSSIVKAFRVKRVVGQITWNEPERNQQRSIKMMTFLTRMRE